MIGGYNMTDKGVLIYNSENDQEIKRYKKKLHIGIAALSTFLIGLSLFPGIYIAINTYEPVLKIIGILVSVLLFSLGILLIIAIFFFYDEGLRIYEKGIGWGSKFFISFDDVENFNFNTTLPYISIQTKSGRMFKFTKIYIKNIDEIINHLDGRVKITN